MIVWFASAFAEPVFPFAVDARPLRAGRVERKLVGSWRLVPLGERELDGWVRAVGALPPEEVAALVEELELASALAERIVSARGAAPSSELARGPVMALGPDGRLGGEARGRPLLGTYRVLDVARSYARIELAPDFGPVSVLEVRWIDRDHVIFVGERLNQQFAGARVEASPPAPAPE